ncbi:hypothetical protein, partial [Pseudorhodobacter sp.]|uniref:hypothetical protein n=1 Tax=Pseudorhodobacter sp. TaxID=1934400 RepID=UPI0039E32894
IGRLLPWCKFFDRAVQECPPCVPCMAGVGCAEAAEFLPWSLSNMPVFCQYPERVMQATGRCLKPCP